MIFFQLKRSLLVSGIAILVSLLLILNAKAATNINYSGNNFRLNSTAESFLHTTTITSATALPYFPKIYSGIGIDHMNINLVNLKVTGLNIGDEIGVFDGQYCVGSMVLSEENMTENSMSIPSSANDSLINSPNGYISGHKISLKAYRNGRVYLLYFQTVNNSVDIFEKGGSMFALVDLSRSTGQFLTESNKSIKIYPNPFTSVLKIEIIIPQKENLTVSIYDINGKTVFQLFEGMFVGNLSLSWNGNDSSQRKVAPGVYFCKVNDTILGIIYQGISLN